MALTRRALLNSSAIGLLPWQATAALKTESLSLSAEPVTHTWFEDAQPFLAWGFDQPLLRFKQHKPVQISASNNLPDPITLHWHGMRVENKMDGVPNVTQSPIQPGQTFNYQLLNPDAGTFWAHTHFKTWQQLARGLYIPVIVDEAEPYPVQDDLLLTLDDWRLNNEYQLDTASLGSLHDWAHDGRKGNFLTINRHPDPQTHQYAPGSRLRLRLLNAANARILNIGFESLMIWAIAKDGQPLTQPTVVKAPLAIGPGERWDLVVQLPDSPGQLARLNEVTGGSGLPIVEFATLDQPAFRWHTLPQPLAVNLPELPNTQPTQRINLDMEGGAMGNLASAMYQGRQLSVQQLVAEKQAWTFNGVANMPEEPLFNSSVGELVEIQINNNTRWPHAMHLHGHHFKVLEDPLHRWQDTVLMEPQQRLTLRVQLHTAGKWLMHCHMVEHSASGMMTWYEVT